MIIMVAGAAKRCNATQLGDFITPDRWQQRSLTAVWAADNAAYTNFDEDRYITMCRGFVRNKAQPVFVTMPDVVGDHRATLALWSQWHRHLGSVGLNRGFVLQDGATRGSIPWRYFEALFIGGSTEFKLGPVVRELVGRAKTMGLWVHMGRVNSVKRAHYARMIGCDSIDGSGLAKFGGLDRVAKSLQQGLLFEEGTFEANENQNHLQAG